MAHGVTSVRDMGCDRECAERLKAHRAAVDSGAAVGPRVLYTGPNLDGAKPLDYAGHVLVTTESATRVVGELADAGADFVKMRDWPSLDEYLAAVDAARAHGLPLDGHLPAAVPISVALSGVSKMA